MSNLKLWLMLVVKDGLKDQDRSFPDMATVFAYDYQEAVSKVRKFNWPQAFWVKGKSICRIIRLTEIGEMVKPGILQMKTSSDLTRIFAGSSDELKMLLGLNPPQGFNDETDADSCLSQPSQRSRTDTTKEDVSAEGSVVKIRKRRMYPEPEIPASAPARSRRRR